MFRLKNEGRQWENLLGCDNGVLSGSPELTMVWFHDLVGVGIGPVSKKLAVKCINVCQNFRCENVGHYIAILAIKNLRMYKAN